MMKRIALTGALAVVFLTALPSSSRATDQSKFDKLIAKYAVPDSGNAAPKTACACNSDNSPGYLVTDNNGPERIYCANPNYLPDGSLNGLNLCASFTVLGK